MRLFDQYYDLRSCSIWIKTMSFIWNESSNITMFFVSDSQPRFREEVLGVPPIIEFTVILMMFTSFEDRQGCCKFILF